MAAEAENLSDSSQSEVSNACDELTSLESSISDSHLDSKNNNKRLQFFLIMLEREKPCLIGRVLVITRNSKKRGKTVQKKNCR